MADSNNDPEDQSEDTSFIEGLVDGALVAQRPSSWVIAPIPAAYIPTEK